MDIQTLTIIVASIALALALEASFILVWHSRKMLQQMNSIKDEISKMKEVSPLELFQPLTALPDSLDDSFGDSKAETVVPESALDPLLEQAYQIFYLRYRQLVSDTTVDNMEENSQNLACLLLEMGYWLKDFLPIRHGDFNATSVQKTNVESITLDDGQRRQTQDQAPLPTTNPYKTPLEVIAIVQKLRQWQVGQFRFLISGFRYQNQNTES